MNACTYIYIYIYICVCIIASVYIYIYIKCIFNNYTRKSNNNQKLQILEALYIRNLQPALNRIIFQTSANVLNVFRYWQ